MAADDEDVEAFFATWERFFRMVRRRRSHWVDDVDKAGPLSFAQYLLVLPLADDGEHSVRELAEMADVAAPTATRLLDGLAAVELVSRRPHDTDRRRVHVELTETGHAALVKQRSIIDAKRRRLYDELSPDERRDAVRVLGRLSSVMSGL